MSREASHHEDTGISLPLTLEDINRTLEDQYDKSITVEQLEDDFDRKMSIWTTSACRSALFGIIDEHKPTGGWQFDKLVLLGAGTHCLVREPGLDEDFHDISMFQHVCAIDLARELTERGHAVSSGIRVFAQDPGYRSQDLEFLSRKGVEVVGARSQHCYGVVESLDAATDHMGPRTLLFNAGADGGPPLHKELCEAKAGFHMRTDHLSWPNYCETPLDDPYSALGLDLPEAIGKFKQSHESCDFPPFEGNPYAFEGLKLYWDAPHDHL